MLAVPAARPAAATRMGRHGLMRGGREPWPGERDRARPARARSPSARGGPRLRRSRPAKPSTNRTTITATTAESTVTMIIRADVRDGNGIRGPVARPRELDSTRPCAAGQSRQSQTDAGGAAIPSSRRTCDGLAGSRPIARPIVTMRSTSRRFVARSWRLSSNQRLSSRPILT